MDCQKHMCGLTNALLWIQLVAEGSLSKWRALGVAITRARYIFVEGSAFGLRRAKGSVNPKEKFSSIKGENLFNQRRKSAKPIGLVGFRRANGSVPCV